MNDVVSLKFNGYGANIFLEFQLRKHQRGVWRLKPTTAHASYHPAVLS